MRFDKPQTALREQLGGPDVDTARRVLAVVSASSWALGMGLSRVYLGHHWLTDVMLAWLFGLGWLALLVTVQRVLLRLRKDPRAGPRRFPFAAGTR